MRISDWSSDVCSSDLPADAVPDFLPMLGFADDASVLAAALVAVGGAINYGHREAARAALSRLRGEIGRASCRERVGKYVYISVVAVSLKTQYRHTQTTSQSDTNPQLSTI